MPWTQARLENETPGDNPVSTLYHLAATETDWLYAGVLEKDFSRDGLGYFPVAVRDEPGHLSRITAEGFETCLDQREFVRKRLRERFVGMNETEYQQLRHLPNYNGSPE